MLISLIICVWFQCNLFFSQTGIPNREGSSTGSGFVVEEFAVGFAKLFIFFSVVV
jgi:hypothetical protein